MDTVNEISSRRTETGKFYELERTVKGRKRFGQEVSTGPIHYRERYRDWDPWLDIDPEYSEKGVAANGELCLVYPRLPNIVRVFRHSLGYEIQSRSNPNHLARVELVSLDGTNARSIPFAHGAKARTDVGPTGVRLWKDLSEIWTPGAHTVRWKVTELGDSAKDSHPFAFRDVPEAFSVADPAGLSLEDIEKARVSIDCQRTRIDDQSWYWDEIIPTEARLVDTDWTVPSTSYDGMWRSSDSFFSNTIDHLAAEAVGYYRFFVGYTSIGIPPGSTILSAHITFYSYTTHTSDANHTLIPNDVANSSAPASAAECDAMAIATNYTTVSVPAGTVAYDTIDSGDIKAGVQEVIDISGWASGNALMFFSGSVTGGAYYISYDFNPTYAPVLTVTWNEPWNHTKHYAGVRHMAARNGVW